MSELSVLSRPAAVEVYSKLNKDSVTQIRLVAKLTSPSLDSNISLADIQNEGRFVVPFNPDKEKYDIWYRSLNESGVGKVIALKTTGVETKLATPMTSDPDDKLFTMDALGNNNDIVAGNTIRIDDEWMVIDSIIYEEDVWTVTVKDRGIHGSAVEVHSLGADVERYRWTVPHQIFSLGGLSEALPAPTNLKAFPETDGIRLTWEWDASDIDKKILDTFVLYWDDETPVDKDADGSLLNINPTPILTGKNKEFKFTPINIFGNFLKETYFFRVAARDKTQRSINESELSNEVSAALGATPLPTEGPPTPEVLLSPLGKFLMQVEAKKPTSVDAGLSIANVASADLEVYVGSNPTTIASPGDKKVGITLVDNSVPYIKNFNVGSEVSEEGGLPQDIWARARFRDANGVLSEWGLSDIVGLTDETNTSDTDIVPVSGIVFDQDVIQVEYLPPFGLSNKLAFGIGADQQEESVVEVELHIRDKNKGITFNQNDGFVGGFAGEVFRFTGSSLGLIFTSLWANREWDATCRVRNAFGWSLFIPPIDIILETDLKGGEDDVPTLDRFAVWTSENPPTPADPLITGTTIGVDIDLGEDNDTTFAVLVYGHGDPFPSETILLDQGGATKLTTSRGSVQVTVEGYNASSDEFKNKRFRFGKSFGKNEGEILEEYVVAENTAGDPFVITLGGNRPTRNDGEIVNWSITDKFLRELVDFFRIVQIDTTGSSGTLNPIQGQRYYFEFAAHAGLKFRASAHNIWGRGAGGTGNPFRFADNTDDGTLSAAGAIVKVVSGIAPADLSIGVKGGVIEGGQIAPTDIDTLAWPAVTFRPVGGGTSYSIDAGNTDNMLTATYIYFDPSVSETAFQTTTSVVTATTGATRFILGWGAPGDVQAQWFPYGGIGKSFIDRQNLTADIITATEIFVTNLASIKADLGEVTAGTITGLLIRTSASGARVELNSTDGLTSIDSGENNRVRIPTSGDRFEVYDDGGVLALTLQSTVKGAASDVEFAIGDATTPTLTFGISDLPWSSIRMQAANTISSRADKIVFRNRNNGLTTDIVSVENDSLYIRDGVTAPPTVSSMAAIYVDSTDGDLKVKFADGTIKTIATDT